MLIKKAYNESTNMQHLYEIDRNRYIIIGTTPGGRITYVRFYDERKGAAAVAYYTAKDMKVLLQQVSCEVEEDGEDYYALDTDMLVHFEDRFEAVYEA